MFVSNLTCEAPVCRFGERHERYTCSLVPLPCYTGSNPAAVPYRRGRQQQLIRDEFFGDLTYEAPSGRGGERHERSEAGDPSGRSRGSYTVAGSGGWGGGARREQRPPAAKPRPERAGPDRVSGRDPSPSRRAGDLGGGWFGDDSASFGADVGGWEDPNLYPLAGAADDLDWDLDAGAAEGAAASAAKLAAARQSETAATAAIESAVELTR